MLASGYTTYSLLSADDQAFARSTKLQYAPHPYTWLAGAQSRSDDLGTNERGARDAVPAIEAENIPLLPMCWRNPLTGQLALQIQPSAVETLLLADGTVLDELEEVRGIVHRMQRPGIAPGLVRAVDWEEGGLAGFNNLGVVHSVSGSFLPGEVRVLRQCDLAANAPPLGPEEGV